MAKYRIPTPPNFKIPDREDPSQPFEAVCTIMPEDNGKTLCFYKIGDTDLDYDHKDGEDEEMEHKPAYQVPSESPAGANPSYT